jgi:glucose/arabinose dehydrogenase
VRAGDNGVIRRTLTALLLLLLATAAAGPPGARAAVTLDPVGSFNDPVFVTSEPNDPDRLLVVEQAGTIELSDDGIVTPYLDLTGLVASGGERGLLSVAPAPDYATTGLLYVYYTRSDGDLQIDEFRATGGSVSLATRRPLLTIEHSRFPNHNGGQLQFGPDGYLYIGTGDGGGSGDPLGSGQSIETLLGKVLRIDPAADGAAPYSIPASNPFVGAAGADEIWSRGLRNPWRFSFDRLTGDLVIGDVGQGAWEEVDFQPAPAAGRGDNFGWSLCEGLHAYPPTNPPTPCAAAATTAPVFEYPHDGACSITGGYVVRDASLGDLYGRYLFTDLCTGDVSSLRLGLPVASDLRAEPALAVNTPSSFGEDSCARVYLAALGTDTVYRLVGDTAPVCPTAIPGPGEPAPPAPATCGGEPVTRAALGGGRLRGTPGDDVIAGSEERDRIRGGGGDDVICGLEGTDTLRGNAGHDVLRGGPARDDLRGGPGPDLCRGGRGNDSTRSC